MCHIRTHQKMPIEHIMEMPSKTTIVQSTEQMLQQAIIFNKDVLVEDTSNEKETISDAQV